MIGCFPWIPNSFLHFCFISFACSSTVRSGFWGNSKVFMAQTSSTTALLETKFVLDDGVPRRSSLILNTFCKEFKVSLSGTQYAVPEPLLSKHFEGRRARWRMCDISWHWSFTLFPGQLPLSVHIISLLLILYAQCEVQTLFCVCKHDIALHTTFPSPFS